MTPSTARPARAPRLPSVLATALVTLALLLPAGARAAPPAAVLHELDAALQDVVARVSPSVVQIQVSGFGPLEASGRSDTSVMVRRHVVGSGVIVDPDGYIVTNQHVVRGARRIRVELPAPPTDSPLRAGTAPPRLYEARVVGAHDETDLAVLKIEAKGLPALKLAAGAPLREGQLVFAIGSPEGLASTATMGVISSVARQADFSIPMLFIQTDAPINPGNSGGPLVNTAGEVVGLNTFIFTQSGGSQGLGFAIPAGVVEFVYRSLRATGRVDRVEIGVSVRSITPPLAAGLGLPVDYGVLVQDVSPDGPASRAGVEPDDVIEAVDGHPIHSLPALATALYQHRPGEPVLVRIRRDGGVRDLSITGAAGHPHDQLASLGDPARNLVPRLGIVGVTIDDRLRAALGGLRGPTGVIVAALTADPSASDTGLQVGDVIHELNRIPVRSLEDLRAALAPLGEGAAVVLRIERQRTLQYLDFELESDRPR